MMGSKLIDFLIDTGTTYSVVSTKLTQKTSQFTPITGVSEEAQNHSSLQSPECQLGDTVFYAMPECPIPLWGQNLLCKLKAQVTFLPEQLDIRGPPTRACFESRDGAHGNPRKGDGALSPLSYLLSHGRTQKHR